MARRKIAASAPTPSSIPIGDCEVTVDASNFACESHPNSLQISVPASAKIRVSVREEMIEKNGNDDTEHIKSGEAEEWERDPFHERELFFVLVNPKDANHSSKSYLQEVLAMYMRELPTMNYAANTGKQSMFLEKCVMNGKYCTLFLKSKSDREHGEVIAAITYQIVPADTQYAEIPLAAVSSIYQHKGFGTFLFMELRKRLQSVGICTIFCWGDKESEGFWHKQGFVSVAEVDTKGRARKLPIKADIRRALCLPGGATLMVSHLNRDISAVSADILKLRFPLKTDGKSSSTAVIEMQPSKLSKEAYNNINSLKQTPIVEHSQPGNPMNNELCGEHYRLDGGGSTKLFTGMELNETGTDGDTKYFSFSTQGSGAKRRVWEASLSSLKSKKVKGTHLVGCQTEPNLDVDVPSESDGYDSCRQRCTLDITKNKSLVGCPPIDPLASSSKEKNAQSCGPGNIASEASIREDFSSQRQCFKVMLMNIADDTKKAHLTKVITDLGGTVTSEGSTSTHVITGKARRTLNFCTALCSGAWIVSACWLKESCRQGRFLDESSYILKDEDYLLKYRAELRTAVLKAKGSPRALLRGYNVCIAAHVQPPARTLSAIVKSAGGEVISGLNKVNDPSKTIFVASEEDMDEALLAVKKGVWTFSSDWLMNCVMRQELDLEAPQFAESL